MPGVVFSINNIFEQTLGEYYRFSMSLSFMIPVAIGFFPVSNIVE
jgi:hypothetical protein